MNNRIAALIYINVCQFELVEKLSHFALLGLYCGVAARRLVQAAAEQQLKISYIWY